MPWGKKKGDQEGRGQLTYHGLIYICHHQPRVVILENVRGILQKRHAGLTTCIKETLGGLGYKVYMKVLNTQDYGVPQSRPRVYVVAVQEKYVQKKFRWPAPVKHSKNALRHFLDTQRSGKEVADLSMYTEKFGQDVLRQNCILDVACSARWASFKAGVCPCLTRSRLKLDPIPFYIPRLSRRLHLGEAARLQGVPRVVAKKLTKGTSRKILGSGLGDGMSINVLSKVLLAALHCIGIVERMSDCDPWQTPTGTPASLAGAADMALEKHLA